MSTDARFPEITAFPVRVFVYGTLLSGEGNHSIFNADAYGWDPASESARLVCRVATRPEFTLYNLGPYPGITPGKSAVVGEVYEVNEEILARLDRLEGHPHHYCRTEHVLADGSRAWIYVYARDPTRWADAEVIASGDWRSVSPWRATQARLAQPAAHGR